MSDNPEKPQIIVDEDWKSQVQAEKEASKSGASIGSTATPGTGQAPVESRAAESTPTSQGGVADLSDVDALPDLDLPPASLLFLCTTLATQAMIALGQVPNPITGKTELRLKQAKHYIDTLGMLEEKTQGNRTAEESAMFDALLHQLRMAYVAINH
jgi:hypothetical protein